MRRLALAAGLAAAATALSACRSEAPPELQPDPALRAALGLDEHDVVHVVQVRGRGVDEVAEPDRITVAPGEWVSFRGGDARGHVVRFDTLALGVDARAWLRDRDQLESPPLLTPLSRWVVSFQEAPPGGYPFVVEGGGATGGGRIDVRTGGS